MKYLKQILLKLFLLFNLVVSAQRPPSPGIDDVDNRVYEFLEISEQPTFPGGVEAMNAFIAKNMKYPEVAMDNGIEGNVAVQFVVDKDGSIINIKVVKDPGGGLGREAERVIKSMPKWKPGKQRETAVRVKLVIPIRFRLANNVNWQTKLAEQGDSKAQHLLGLMYYSGDGIIKDDKQAMYWWLKSAEQGNTQAQLDLGYLYSSNEGDLKNYKQAFYWYTKSAEQGNAKAQLNLGLMYFDGKGVSKSRKKAAFWMKKAYDNGHKKAKDFLDEYQLWQHVK
jgi:hypothetical protein